MTTAELTFTVTWAAGSAAAYGYLTCRAWPACRELYEAWRASRVLSEETRPFWDRMDAIDAMPATTPEQCAAVRQAALELALDLGRREERP